MTSSRNNLLNLIPKDFQGKEHHSWHSGGIRGY